MKRKIYGVPGQLECKLIITSGSTKAEVVFKGGSIRDITRSPARYVTSSLLEQTIIENSNEFKVGKIVKIHEIDIPDEPEEPAEPARQTSAATEPTIQQSTGNGADRPGTTSQAVVVADKGDAIEWLKEHFPGNGYTATKLRKDEAFTAACAECGVSFRYQNEA